MKKISLFIITLLTISMSLISHPVFAAIKTIQFATEATYPPFEYVTADGQIKGFDIDLANALCQQIKAQCTFVNQPWDSLIPSLNIGKFDAIIGSMAITAARKKVVDFTDSYYNDTASFVAAKTANLDLSEHGLKNKTIGVQGGTTFEQYLQAKYANGIKIKPYTSIQDAFLDLIGGRVDAVLGDTPLIIDWQKKNGSNNFVTVGKPIDDPKFFGTGNGIAVRKGNKELVDALNKALAEIKANGVYQKIIQQNFGSSQ